MNRIWAIAKNTHREAIRDRVLYSLLFFACVILVATLVTEEITIGDQDKIMRGVALGSISLFSSVIAMFLGVSLVYKELERKTIYTIASKPIPRWMFVLGKYTGLLLTLGVNVVVMSALYLLIMGLKLGMPHPSLAAFLVLLFVELMLLTAWATLFSTYSGPTTATAFTLAIFVIGHLADDIWSFGQQAESASLQRVSEILYWVLPNFEVLNVQPEATHQLAISLGRIGTAAGYGLAYTAVVLIAAILVFQKRDFK
jgi:ABC-type transport system involved in multi-copper enzyme maturation permease subunit